MSAKCAKAASPGQMGSKRRLYFMGLFCEFRGGMCAQAATRATDTPSPSLDRETRRATTVAGVGRRRQYALFLRSLMLAAHELVVVQKSSSFTPPPI